MTTKEVAELIASETKKLEALKQIAEILEKLENEVDSDAVEWVIEKIQE